MVRENTISKRRSVWSALRLVLGLIFLWSFFDKTFGLGYSTATEKAWIAGGSPTMGFLSSTSGPLAGLFQTLAGQVWVDWLFMLGLLGIGLALTFGILVRLASVSGAFMMVLMWLAAFPSRSNPLLDSHVIYLIILIGFLFVHSGKRFGCGTWWCKRPWVEKYFWLE